MGVVSAIKKRFSRAYEISNKEKTGKTPEIIDTFLSILQVGTVSRGNFDYNDRTIIK